MRFSTNSATDLHSTHTFISIYRLWIYVSLLDLHGAPVDSALLLINFSIAGCLQKVPEIKLPHKLANDVWGRVVGLSTHSEKGSTQNHVCPASGTPRHTSSIFNQSASSLAREGQTL